MELFHSIRESFQTLGVYPVQSLRETPFNLRNIFVLMCLTEMFTSSLAYSLFEAKSIGEFADSIFMSLINLAWAITFVSNIYKISHILALIEDFEKFIEKSKFVAVN